MIHASTVIRASQMRPRSALLGSHVGRSAAEQSG
jgi:hypothetical protein